MEQQLFSPGVLPHRATQDTQGLQTAASPNARGRGSELFSSGRLTGNAVHFGTLLLCFASEGKVWVWAWCPCWSRWDGMSVLTPSGDCFTRISQCPREAGITGPAWRCRERTETVPKGCARSQSPKVAELGFPPSAWPLAGSFYLHLLTPAPPSLSTQLSVSPTPIPHCVVGTCFQVSRPYLRVLGFRPGH